jgi:hypothetical protein
MANKITLDLPEYISIDLYQQVEAYKGDSPFGKLIKSVSVITGLPVSQVREWPITTLTQIANDFAELADPKETFHTLFEYDGEMYGFANIKQTSVGEWIDLETFTKNPEGNLHKIAAILYRPVTDHRFGSLKWAVKSHVKSLRDSIENPFDYYTIEKYDSDKLDKRADKFKNLPVDIVLGGVSFFLSTASLYLNHIQYLEGNMSRRTKERHENQILSLLESIGGGLVPFTVSLRPTYFQSLETNQSQT